MQLIFQPNGDEVDLEEYFESNGVSTDIKNTAITNTSLAAMVRHGLGAGIMCETVHDMCTGCVRIGNTLQISAESFFVYKLHENELFCKK